MTVEYAADQAHNTFDTEARCKNDPLCNNGNVATKSGLWRCINLLQLHHEWQQVYAAIVRLNHCLQINLSIAALA
jgi:hypothetical protein